MTDIAPPAANTWDVDAVAAQALAVLRLESGDVDEARIRTDAETACRLVDDHVDRVEEADPSAPMLTAAVAATVALYRGAGGVTAVAAYLPPGVGGPVAEAVSVADGDRQRWGVA